MESARIERMLFIPGIFLPSRLDGKEIDTVQQIGDIFLLFTGQ